MTSSRGLKFENNNMTRAFPLAFKQKMVQRLTGKDAVSALQLARETGIRQQNLSRWLQDARSLPVVASDNVPKRKWTVEQKARVLAEASSLAGEPLHAHLEREGVRLVDSERWRVALEEDGRESAATTKRVRRLERELARKEKALAEAAAQVSARRAARGGQSARLGHERSHLNPRRSAVR